jgi:hypothetical protein
MIIINKLNNLEETDGGGTTKEIENHFPTRWLTPKEQHAPDE